MFWPVALTVSGRPGLVLRVRESVAYAGADCLRMTGGEEIDTRSLIWCVGVRPDPLVEDLALSTDHGRLRVHETLAA